MENKNIIIILLVIVVILLAAVLGAILLNSSTAKEQTKLKITSDNEQYEDGAVLIQLTGLNNTPISKEIVNITITNDNGEKVVDDVVKTDSNGIAKLNLDLTKGNYNVNVSYGGNENYTGNNTTQKLTIKENEVESTNSESTGDVYADTNSPSRYTNDEYGTYDNVHDVYISGQAAGLSKSELQYYIDLERRNGGRGD